MNENAEPCLKIAILLDRFAPSRGGERYFSLLAEGLAQKGHDVHIFASEVEKASDIHYKVHILPVIKRPRSLHILSFMLESSRALKGKGFDIIHGEALSTAINIYNPHGGAERAYLRQEFASIEGVFYRGVRYLKRYLSPRYYLETALQTMLFKSRKVKKIIAVSEMVKHDIMDHYRVEDNRLAVIFDSIDTERFRPANKKRFRNDVRRSLGLNEEEPVLLFASNNYRLKGLTILLAALAHLKQKNSITCPCLIVLGRGRAGHYSRIAKKLGIDERVHFLGPTTDIERYYAASDLYVHPTFYDSCALTILEALATGIPVVTTRFAGASAMVQEGLSGFVLMDPSNAFVLSERIEQCLQPEFLERAETIARETASRFALSRNIEETIQVYRGLVNSRKSLC